MRAITFLLTLGEQWFGCAAAAVLAAWAGVRRLHPFAVPWSRVALDVVAGLMPVVAVTALGVATRHAPLALMAGSLVLGVREFTPISRKMGSNHALIPAVVTAARVAKVVARLKARLAQAPLDIGALLARLADRDAGGPLKWIRASLGAAMKLIPTDDVLYFQAEDKYTKVVTADGEALIRKSIRELFEELDPEGFWQIHRGTIVNLRAIARVERDWRDQPVILLKDRPEKLSVSRTFASRFKAM